MEKNKENRTDRIRPRTSTKIPLPLDPLPLLPRKLVESKEDKMQRPPLRTINNQAGPSCPNRQVPRKRQYTPRKLDTKFVTVRSKTSDLDWDFKVFKDAKFNKSNSVICISDEGEVESEGCELQELPRPKKQQKGEKVKRRLFVENLTERLEPPDFLSQLYMASLSRHYTSDIFKYLIQRERKPVAVPKILNVTRACIINWLIKVNGADGNPATVQTACWYLDSVLAVGSVELEKLQLVAAACMWIAQKLQGPAVSAMKLVRCANHAFTPAQLFVAEKAILAKLRFPLQPVVADSYIGYLSWWCDCQNPGEIEVAAIFLSLSGMMVDRVLCDEYPSVVAAAAVKNALLLLNKRHLLRRLEMSMLYKLAEKKSQTISYTCLVLRKAVRMVSSPMYAYKAPLELYGSPAHYNIAQRIVQRDSELAALDAKKMS